MAVDRCLSTRWEISSDGQDLCGKLLMLPLAERAPSIEVCYDLLASQLSEGLCTNSLRYFLSENPKEETNPDSETGPYPRLKRSLFSGSRSVTIS